MYTYIYIYIHTCIYIYIYVCTCMYTCEARAPGLVLVMNITVLRTRYESRYEYSGYTIA